MHLTYLAICVTRWSLGRNIPLARAAAAYPHWHCVPPYRHSACGGDCIDALCCGGDLEIERGGGGVLQADSIRATHTLT